MKLDYKAIGKRIKIARIKADLTQEQLAENVSLSVSHMSNIETGTTKVSLTALVSIANALSVSVDELLCDNLVSARPQLEHEVQQVLSKCSPYELHIISGLCKVALELLRANERFLNQP